MSKLTKAQQADKAEALLKLHEILKPGAKIHAEASPSQCTTQLEGKP